MIEFCTKKRMGIAILALIFVSVIVLVIENNMSMDSDIRDATHPPGTDNHSAECWATGDFTVVHPCRPCNSLEKRIQNKCRSSGYLEMVQCTSLTGLKTDVYRSCPKLSWIEERNFWVFEMVMAVVGLGAYSVVHMRQKTLDRLLLEKVHKQIAAGV